MSEHDHEPARAELPRSFMSALLGIAGIVIATGIIATVSLYAQVQTISESLRATQQAEEHTAQALAKHLDHAVDKDDYLRDKQHTDSALGQMATKDDVRALQDMILDLMGGGGAAKYRKIH